MPGDVTDSFDAWVAGLDAQRLAGMDATQLAEAGAVDVYPCPCEARGVLIEAHPAVFTIIYGHDDWCPVLGGQSPSAAS